uniref:Uncharacterized protein n=2 Tax=Cacopsylla melanoneura TaxID=428564 RepID=A0A8D9AWK5_9HEMI
MPPIFPPPPTTLFSSSHFFFRSLPHFGQYHFPFGLVVSETHAKWNHSIGQSGLSQPIISPYDTCWQTQYVGSFGSTGMSRTSCVGAATAESEVDVTMELSTPTTPPATDDFFPDPFFFDDFVSSTVSLPASSLSLAFLRPRLDLEAPAPEAPAPEAPAALDVVFFNAFSWISCSNLAKSVSNLRIYLSTISYVCIANCTLSSPYSFVLSKYFCTSFNVSRFLSFE